MLWYYNLIHDTFTLSQKIVCPFHADVNPSMIVDLVENDYFCFGCGERGTALDFVITMEKQHNGLNELQSCIKYYKILNSKKASTIKVTEQKTKTRKQNKLLYNMAYDHFAGLKQIDWKDRNNGDDVKQLKQYMWDRGFTGETLNKTKAKQNYSKNYPLIFPMHDNGTFKGWVCRTNDREVAKKRKYLYNEGFSRATTLVGDYGKEDFVIVVEGYMDRLKFVQAGYENVVAILGWKATQEQIKKLKGKGITKVISALDNDISGKKGTAYLRGFFEVTPLSYLKGIKDPGETTTEQLTKMYTKTMIEFNKKDEVLNDGNIRQNKRRSKKQRSKQR